MWIGSRAVTRWPAAGFWATTVSISVMGAMGAMGRRRAGWPDEAGAVTEPTGAMGLTLAETTSMLAMRRPMAETRAEAAVRVRPMRLGIT